MSMPWDMQDGGPQRWGQDARHDEGAEGRWEDHRCQILLDATLRRRWLLLFDRNQPKRALKLNPPAAPSASLSPFLPFSISPFLHFSISPFLLPHPPSDFLFHYFCRFLLKRINPRHLSPIKKRQTNKQTNKQSNRFWLLLLVYDYLKFYPKHILYSLNPIMHINPPNLNININNNKETIKSMPPLVQPASIDFPLLLSNCSVTVNAIISVSFDRKTSMLSKCALHSLDFIVPINLPCFWTWIKTDVIVSSSLPFQSALIDPSHAFVAYLCWYC